MVRGTGVKGIIRKDDRFLVLVKHDGSFDLPGGRVEEGETIKSALHREINEGTGLKVDIKETAGKWSFSKKPNFTINFTINGITFACTYLEGTVELCKEHTNYFWAGIDKIQGLTFSREIPINFRYTYPSYCKLSTGKINICYTF